MITAVIIDDEAKGRVALRKKLDAFCPQVEIVGEAENGVEGIRLISSSKPDVVFLDIEMPQMNGFDMLQRLDRKDFQIIFTTAYDQYAIKAIRHAAFDYLLKPIDVVELQATIQKVIQHQGNLLTQERFETLKHNLSGHFQYHKIAIPSMEGILFFDLAEIMYFRAESNYSYVVFKDGTRLLTTKTLRDFEDILPSQLFFRPHHSFIVHLQYIKRYIKGDGGQIEMQNGDYIDVSRSKKSDFLKIISGT